MVQTKVVTTLIVFRQYTQFYTDSMHNIYKLSTDYVRAFFFEGYIQIRSRLSTDYTHVLKEKKTDNFGSHFLFLVEKLLSA